MNFQKLLVEKFKGTNYKMLLKRVTIISGHYGSGKTNIAVNLAIGLKKEYNKVALADIDIVNPYFRSKDSEKLLAEKGVKLICSPYANSNVDIPALPQEMYSVTDDKEMRAILDVGGDDRGALALGRISPKIIEENDYEMIYVVNFYRPLTQTVDLAIEVMREIEYAGKIKFTSIVNNSNLGKETKKQDVLDTVLLTKELSLKTGLPVKFTSVEEKLYNELKDEIENLYPISMQKKP